MIHESDDILIMLFFGRVFVFLLQVRSKITFENSQKVSVFCYKLYQKNYMYQPVCQFPIDGKL